RSATAQGRETGRAAARARPRAAQPSWSVAAVGCRLRQRPSFHVRNPKRFQQNSNAICDGVTDSHCPGSPKVQAARDSRPRRCVHLTLSAIMGRNCRIPQRMYKAVTRAIEVNVEPSFMPDRSSAEKHYYFWAYRILIVNRGTETVQLKTRHWI